MLKWKEFTLNQQTPMAEFLKVIYLFILIRILESSIHNNLMHDCNRHRENGYMDVTWATRIPEEFIEEFQKRRTID
jgi:hypothetical protein